MLGFFRKVVVAMLKASGRADLVEVAAWIEDAEAEVVHAIAKVLTQSMRGDSIISDEAAIEVVGLRRAPSRGHITTTKSLHPFLDEYVECLRMVVELGSWRSGLLLQGFVHSSECASYWEFDLSRDPKFEILGTPAMIVFDSSSLKVFLVDPLGPDDVKRINEALGQPGAIPSELTVATRQQVRAVEEHEIEVAFDEIHERAVRPDAKGLPRSVKEHTTATKSLPIDTKSWSGFAALAESLPVALQARGGPLNRLREILGTKRQ